MHTLPISHHALLKQEDDAQCGCNSRPFSLPTLTHCMHAAGGGGGTQGC